MHSSSFASPNDYKSIALTGERRMKPAKPSLVEATETDITVQFSSVSESGATYRLEWKVYSQSWENATSKAVVAKEGTMKAQAEPLEPGTTYCLRLVVSANGEESTSDELVLDTEQVGCTPKSESCCVML